ncbi:MAG: hypothetical protein PT936_10100 [Treponema sp.]|nr:hypothetical protein [Treponema sp.]
MKKLVKALRKETAKNRRHDKKVNEQHEIYLSDPRKSTPDKQKTVIRHPVKKDK